ncbi:MAG: hypothetical protein IT183_11800 [Acidobacteria bacterium]|nr:hypothetical protein [Acidobacteriota bacterium]
MTDPVDRDGQVERLLRQSLPAGRPASSSCVDAEQLAAWSAGSLRREDAAMVERHLADCTDCQAMLAAFVESEPVPTVATVPFWQRWSLRWLVPVAAAGAAVLVWTFVSRPPAGVPEPSTTMARAEQEPVPQTAAPAIESSTRSEAMEATRPPMSPRAAVPSAAAPAPVFQARSSELAAIAPAAGAAGASRDTAMERQAAAPFETATARPTPPVPGVAAAEPSASLKTEPTVAPAPAAPPAPAVAADRRFSMAAGSANVMMDALAVGSIVSTHARSGAVPVQFAFSDQADVRWRIQPQGRVDRSGDRGQTWTPVDLGPATTITAGSAPVADVCWLVGRDGVVLRSTTGVSFERRPFPGVMALTIVEALDAARATVTTAEGTVFTTADGGATWTQRP